jgi:hypothetical protein
MFKRQKNVDRRGPRKLSKTFVICPTTSFLIAHSLKKLLNEIDIAKSGYKVFIAYLCNMESNTFFCFFSVAVGFTYI